MKHGKQNKLKTLESLKTQAKEVKVTCFDPAIVLIPIPISTYLPVTDVRRHHPGNLLLEPGKENTADSTPTDSVPDSKASRTYQCEHCGLQLSGRNCLYRNKMKKHKAENAKKAVQLEARTSFVQTA